MNNNLTFLIETSEKQVMGNRGHHPQLCLFGSKGNTLAVLTSMPEDKHFALMMVGQELAKNPQAQKELGELEEVYFISEAWISLQTELNPDGTAKVMPRDDPHRAEVLIIAGKNLKSGENYFSNREMIRDKEGKVLFLRELPDMGGRMEMPILQAFLDGYTKGQEDDKELQRN